MTITTAEYKKLEGAYSFFNMRLFDGKLPPCLITLNRKRHAGGYFSPERFNSRTNEDKCDEIALNPDSFASYTDEFIYSILVHEMAHLWQHHFGKPSRGGYHNAEWGTMMKSIGLHPSSTSKPGGKETGGAVGHYIIEGGAFQQACAVWLKGEEVKIGFQSIAPSRVASASRNKVKYTCPSCNQNAWAKPDASLMCGECREDMEEA